MDMLSTTSWRNATKSQAGLGAKREVAESPGAPVRVTEDAQASHIDVNGLRDFVFESLPYNDLPARPSTSGGPVATSSSWRYPDDRRTSDELLYTRPAPDGGMTIFNFPKPGSGPAPASSFNVSPPQLLSSTRWPLTLESSTTQPANMSVPPMAIGMALGSPSHQLTTWPAEPNDLSTVSPSPDPTEYDNVSEVAPTKHKHSKWNPLRAMFGGHHKKAHPGPDHPFYQLQSDVTFVTTIESGQVDGTDGSGGKEKSQRSRSRGRSFSGRRSNKHKPDVKRAATTPVKFNFEDLERGRPRAGNPRIMFHGDHLTSEPHEAHMFLDVDIPSVHMERYSVMFGSVLGKSAGNRSSSLLARRQATIDRLKTANEEIAMVEKELAEKAQLLMPRRATSPHIMKSPALSLFPNPPSSSRLNVNDGKKSPLQRSNTSPAALSPARQTFALSPDPGSPPKQALPPPTTLRQAQEQNSSRHDGGRGKRAVNPALQSNPTTSSRRDEPIMSWAPGHSHLRLESPDNGLFPQAEEGVYDRSPLVRRPMLREPVWDMQIPQQNGPSSVADSSTSGSDHSASNSASSTSTTSTPPNDSPIEKVNPSVHAPQELLLSRSVTTTDTPLRPSRIPRREDRAPSLPGLDRRRENSADGRLRLKNDTTKTPRIPQLHLPIVISKTNEKQSPSPLDLTRTASPLAEVAAGESPVMGRVGRAFVLEVKSREKMDGGEERKRREKKKERGGDGVSEIRIGRKASEVGEIKVGFMIETGTGKHVHRRSEQVVLEG